LSASEIKNVRAWKVFDSRGKPTIEIGVTTRAGYGRATAPSGLSRGKWEVEQYPPGGIEEAIRIVEDVVAPKLINRDASEQESIDALLHEIDGTPNFRKIGGNTAYAVSVAVALAAADSTKVHLFEHLSRSSLPELPLPLGNVIGGGRHAQSSRTDIQEFLVLPVGARTFHEAAEANARVHNQIAALLEEKGKPSVGKGDEGAWIADLTSEEAFEIVQTACECVSDSMGVEMRVGADLAASTLWSEKKRTYEYGRDGRRLSEEQQFEFLVSLIEKYDLVYLEDPFHEDAFEAFAELAKEAGNTLICGDDLFVTDLTRFMKGRAMKAGNAIVIKPNQVGTVSDAYGTAREAKRSGYATVTSHRSGDTVAAELAHLALAFGSPLIKTGVVGGERVAKINELMRIENELGEKARLARIKLRSEKD
jgi:enolase